MNLKIATAECFTHGKVAEELHAFARGYPHQYPFTLRREEVEISVIAGLFLPTLASVKTILRIEPLEPKTVVDTIKVYEQEADCRMAFRMAEAVMRLTGADIGIGTTAGIGKGAVAVVATGKIYSRTSAVYADFRSAKPDLLIKREKSGVFTALKLFEEFLVEGSYPDQYDKYVNK
ncbi:MAG TPA: UPF0254 family protein [Methanocorpusculum sp.]|nr:UPF0254 family protein [Methanocorpusculum sp.]HJK80982.1 UPF0254 family protein [Methanocorpusculum sp.]